MVPSRWADCAACQLMKNSSPDVEGLQGRIFICIRAYNEKSDVRRVDAVEKLCESAPGPSAGSRVSLFTDLLGDPLCRVRHFPAYAMLVAGVHTDVGDFEIVGMIRAGIKQVVSTPVSIINKLPLEECRTANAAAAAPGVVFAPTAYILGLRVAPRYRRLGIGVELVKQMEAWCRAQGAEYSYIATEKDNEASVNLFTRKLGYFKFRRPAILVQSVYTCRKRQHPEVKIVEVSKDKAEALYRSVFKEREFFPKDVDAIMRSKLHKGTWVAVWRDNKYKEEEEEEEESNNRVVEEKKRAWPSGNSNCAASWAVLSVWKCNEIFKVEVKGAGLLTRSAVAAARMVGKLVHKVVGSTVATPPSVFKPFGLQLLYGLHAHGATGSQLLRELCWFAHNLAYKDGCAVVAAEVGSCDPLRACVPHWPSLSCDEDLWCIKRLISTTASHDDDWSKSSPPLSLFVDPRDF